MLRREVKAATKPSNLCPLTGVRPAGVAAPAGHQLILIWRSFSNSHGRKKCFRATGLLFRCCTICHFVSLTYQFPEADFPETGLISSGLLPSQCFCCRS